MFFRPSFCAHCGEKIERSDWGVFSSRRFCQVCESEFKGVDLIPRVIVGAGVLAGVLGLGAYIRSGNAETRPARLASLPIERQLAAPTREQLPPNLPATTPAPASQTPPSTAPSA